MNNTHNNNNNNNTYNYTYRYYKFKFLGFFAIYNIFAEKSITFCNISLLIVITE